MIIKGDINGDGRITLEDLTLFQAYIVGMVNLSEQQLQAADINGNGELDNEDLRSMENHIYGHEMINEVIE